MIVIENIISGFVGSIIGITISGAFGRLTNAIKLNNYRKLIIVCSNNIIISNAKAYSDDYFEAKNVINNYYKIKFEGLDNNIRFNMMPMFNSEIYRSIPSHELFKIFKLKKTYADFIDSIYSIDFLIQNMPRKQIIDFHKNIEEHLSKENIDAKNIATHLKDCKFLSESIIAYVGECDNKIKRVSALICELKRYNKELGGSSFIWIIRYLYN